MEDYLQSIGKGWRIAGIIACTFAAGFFLLMSLAMSIDMIRNHKFDHEGKPHWIGAAMVGILGIAAAFIAWRLIRHGPTANNITLMPVWFIQYFGLLLLLGLAFFTYEKGITLLALETAFIGLAMIFVGRNIARKRRQKM